MNPIGPFEIESERKLWNKDSQVRCSHIWQLMLLTKPRCAKVLSCLIPHFRSVILDALNSTSSVLENSFATQHGVNNLETNGGNCGNFGNGNSNGVGERGEEERMSWLQRQQQKLQERREGQKKTQQESAFLIKELKTSLERARSGGTETTDGYASDVNSLLCSETSREPSPAKQQIYQVPLQVEERAPVQQESKIQQSSFQNSDLRGANSETRARSSSEVGTRSSESGFHSSESSSQQQVYSSVQTSESSNQQIYSSVQKRSLTPSMSSKKAAELKSMLNRQRSDTSYDRSWPGVQRRRQDSESEAELSMLRTNGAQNGSCGSIDSAGMLCGGSRPITPAFPQVSSHHHYYLPNYHHYKTTSSSGARHTPLQPFVERSSNVHAAPQAPGKCPPPRKQVNFSYLKCLTSL